MRCALVTLIFGLGVEPSAKVNNPTPQQISSLGVTNQQISEPPTYVELQPIFIRSCNACHSGPFASKGLATDSYASLIKGSSSGPVVIAGNPQGSALIQRTTGKVQPQMPLTGPPFLADTEINLFTSWILAGMPQGQEATPPVTPSAHKRRDYLCQRSPYICPALYAMSSRKRNHGATTGRLPADVTETDAINR